jgi:hypothetical protein
MSMAAEDPIKTILHYTQALKGPRIRESAARLAAQARDGGWTHEKYLAAALSREVAAREASGAATRIRSAGFPTRKSWENFDFDHQPALNRDMVAHLGTGAFLAKARNVVLLGPGGRSTRCWSPSLGSGRCPAHRSTGGRSRRRRRRRSRSRPGSPWSAGTRTATGPPVVGRCWRRLRRLQPLQGDGQRQALGGGLVQDGGQGFGSGVQFELGQV